MNNNLENVQNLKVRILVLEKDSNKPLKGLPICLESLGGSNQSQQKKLLVTNKKGYVSFKLTRIDTSQVDAIKIFPLDYESLNTTLSISEVLQKEFHYLPVPQGHPSLTLVGLFEGLQSYELPDRIDYQMAGNQLASLYGASMGGNNCDCEDNPIDTGFCEKLLPGFNLKRNYGLHQLAFKGDLKPSEAILIDGSSPYCVSDVKYTDPYLKPKLKVREGESLEFDVEWCFLGHSLGELINSFSLAPCESIKLATINWVRRDTVQRQDETTSVEYLNHDQRHDRLIDETMDVSVKERSIGGSSQTALKAAIPGKIPISIAGVYKISGQIGRKDVAANSMQTLNDRIKQSSSSLRSIRGTVVMEAVQKEDQKIQTRGIKNHNKCHTLNLMYYEMVRHYEVVTKYVGKHDICFIQYCVEKLTPEKIIAHSNIFRGNLLDESLNNCYNDFIESYLCCSDSVDVRDPGNNEGGNNSGGNSGSSSNDDLYETNKIRVRIRIGKDKPGSNGQIKINIKLSNGNIITVPFPQSSYNKNTTYSHDINLPSTISAEDIVQIGLSFSSSGVNNDFKMDEFVVQYKSNSNGNYYQVYGNTNLNDTRVQEKSPWWVVANPQLPPKPVEDPTPTPTSTPTPTDESSSSDCEKMKCCEKIILNHFKEYELYYNSLIWLNEDAIKRGIRFDRYNYNGDYLLPQIINSPIGVVGNWVAFLKSDSILDNTDKIPDEVSTVFLPSKGAYMEALLGQCSACETVDPKSNEYRDWECQELAPAIDPIKAENLRPYQQLLNINPMQLPSTSLLEIQDIQKIEDGPGLIAKIADILDKSKFPDHTKLEILDKLLEALPELPDPENPTSSSSSDSSSSLPDSTSTDG